MFIDCIERFICHEDLDCPMILIRQKCKQKLVIGECLKKCENATSQSVLKKKGIVDSSHISKKLIIDCIERLIRHEDLGCPMILIRQKIQTKIGECLKKCENATSPSVLKKN